jgi:hypothetical protein
LAVQIGDCCGSRECDVHRKCLARAFEGQVINIPVRF